jgi:predicted nuclease with TOPRIM domain
MQDILTPISPGELIDKITILEIKAERIKDAAKLQNVRHELQLLQDTWRRSGHDQATIQSQWDELRRINAELWDIEDRIRDEERAQRFEAEFIRLARAVYVTNDERARVKREINTLLGSRIVEEKSYADYKSK